MFLEVSLFDIGKDVVVLRQKIAKVHSIVVQNLIYYVKISTSCI